LSSHRSAHSYSSRFFATSPSRRRCAIPRQDALADRCAVCDPPRGLGRIPHRLTATSSAEIVPSRASVIEAPARDLRASEIRPSLRHPGLLSGMSPVPPLVHTLIDVEQIGQQAGPSGGVDHDLAGERRPLPLSIRDRLLGHARAIFGSVAGPDRRFGVIKGGGRDQFHWRFHSPAGDGSAPTPSRCVRPCSRFPFGIRW